MEKCQSGFRLGCSNTNNTQQNFVGTVEYVEQCPLSHPRLFYCFQCRRSSWHPFEGYGDRTGSKCWRPRLETHLGTGFLDWNHNLVSVAESWTDPCRQAEVQVLDWRHAWVQMAESWTRDTCVSRGQSLGLQTHLGVSGRDLSWSMPACLSTSGRIPRLETHLNLVVCRGKPGCRWLSLELDTALGTGGIVMNWMQIQLGLGRMNYKLHLGLQKPQ